MVITMKYIENEQVELKREWNKDKHLKEVVAFLNTRDGKIIIGVDDNGKIIGVNNLDKLLTEIMQNILDLILPTPEHLFNLTSEMIDGKFIIVIDIKKGDKLYYIKKYGKSSSGCFYKNGTSCLSLSEEEINKRLKFHQERTELKDIPILRKDLSFNILKNYLTTNKITINEDNFLVNNHLITKDNKYNLLADLLSDQNEIRLSVSRFNGVDKSEFIKRTELGNVCLLFGIDKVINFVNSLNETHINVNVRPRMEKNTFDKTAFEEAWINACVHNLWEKGLSPQVFIFSNRIEIISWGGIPSNITKEQFLSGLSKPVNPDLMNIFIKCNFVEQSGYGVPKILKVYGESAFEFYEDRIIVKIPLDNNGFEKVEKNPINEIDINKAIEINQQTNKNPIDIIDTIIEIIKSNKYVTREQIAKQINKSVKTVGRIIAKSNKIVHKGSLKKGYWEIIE